MKELKITLNDIKEKDTTKIKSVKLLAVEGQDEWYFFKRFLEKHLKISDVQIIDIGGESNFASKLELLRLSPDFSKVEIIGFIQNADNDIEKSFEKIQVAIKDNLNMIAPRNINTWEYNKPQLGVFILPNSIENGMLEDLCLKSVASDPIMPCLDAYFKCIEGILPKNKQPKNIAKTMTQAFLASRKEYKSSVGFAVEEDYWNFDDDCMKEIKDFLTFFKQIDRNLQTTP